MVRVLLAALLGGVGAFIWGFVSWMVLELHNPNMQRFSNEEAVERVIQEGISSGPGLYVYPNYCPDHIREDENAEERAAAQQEFMEGKYRGIFMHAAIGQETGDTNMGKSMGINFGANVLASLMIAILLCWAGVKSFIGRVVFVEIVAVFTALTSAVPQWIWWPIPDRHTLITIVDLGAAWGLAGILIALALGGAKKSDGGGDSED